MPDDPDRLFGIYLALDEAYLHEAVPSLKIYAQVAELIDHIRSSNPASEFLPLAESILVTMHRLQPALTGKVECSDEDKSRRRLKKMCDAWLRACPLRAANSDPEVRTLVAAI